MSQAHQHNQFANLVVIRGGRLLSFAHVRHPFFSHKRSYNPGQSLNYHHQRLSNTENKMVLVFTLEVNPIPNLGLSLAGSAVNETRLWFVEHVAARLHHMYGSPESVPPLNNRLTFIGAPELVPPASGQAPLKGAMLYFLPDDLKKRIEGVWPTSAKLDLEKAQRSRLLTPNPRPKTPNLLSPGASDVSRDSFMHTLAQAVGASDVSRDSFMSTLARAFLPSEAHATDPPDRYHFFHTDHLGSTRVVTDETGAVYEKIDYLPLEIWGHNTYFFV